MVWAVMRRNCAVCVWRFVDAIVVGSAVGNAVGNAVGDAFGDVVGNAAGEMRSSAI